MKKHVEYPLLKHFLLVAAVILSCFSAMAQIDMENLDPENSIIFLVQPATNAEWLPFNSKAQELMQVQVAIDKSRRHVFVAYGDVYDKGAKYTCTNFYVNKDIHGNAVVSFTFNDHRLVIWSQPPQCLIMLENKQNGSLWKYSNFTESEEWLLALMPDLANSGNFNYDVNGKMIRLVNILDKARNLGIIKFSTQ